MFCGALGVFLGRMQSPEMGKRARCQPVGSPGVAGDAPRVDGVQGLVGLGDWLSPPAVRGAPRPRCALRVFGLHAINRDGKACALPTGRQFEGCGKGTQGRRRTEASLYIYNPTPVYPNVFTQAERALAGRIQDIRSTGAASSGGARRSSVRSKRKRGHCSRPAVTRAGSM